MPLPLPATLVSIFTVLDIGESLRAGRTGGRIGIEEDQPLGYRFAVEGNRAETSWSCSLSLQPTRRIATHRNVAAPDQVRTIKHLD